MKCSVLKDEQTWSHITKTSVVKVCFYDIWKHGYNIKWYYTTVQPCFLLTVKYYWEMKFSMSCMTY